MTYNHNFYGISTRVKFFKKIAHSLVREMISDSDETFALPLLTNTTMKPKLTKVE